MNSLLTIKPGSWSEFEGFYVSSDVEHADYDYIVGDAVYHPDTLERAGAYFVSKGSEGRFEPATPDDVLTSRTSFLVPPFTINRDGSEMLVIQVQDEMMIYQQLSNRSFVELLPRYRDGVEVHKFGNVWHTFHNGPPRKIEWGRISGIYILQVPLPGGKEVKGFFQRLPLSKLNPNIIELLNRNGIRQGEIPDFNKITRILNFGR